VPEPGYSPRVARSSDPSLSPDDLPRSARDFFPDRPSPTLEEIADAALGCRGCDLYQNATQTVFGEGAPGARVMLVGEQPGDKEDLAGHPFVGPSGKLLDTALAEAGIDRATVYITNVVKHFKWKAAPSGKRRIHEKPNQVEITACRPWLEAELAHVRPEVVVCLGATAAQAILGPTFRVTRDRGRFFSTDLASLVTATVHPSSILRSADAGSRSEEMALFIRDLSQVSAKLAEIDAQG
jgi:uracil-DNA glycosylase